MLANILKGYEEEKTKLREELSVVQTETLWSESVSTDITREIENLKQYTEITELDRQVVTSLIQSIHVSEGKKIDGEKVYNLGIRYKFQNPFAHDAEAKKEDAVLRDTESSG